MKILKRVLLVILVLTCVGSVTALAKPSALANIDIAGIGRTDWIKDIAKDNQLAYDLGFYDLSTTAQENGFISTTYDRLDFKDYYLEDNQMKIFNKEYDGTGFQVQGPSIGSIEGGNANLIIINLLDYYDITKKDFKTTGLYDEIVLNDNIYSVEKNNKMYIYSYWGSAISGTEDENIYNEAWELLELNKIKKIETCIQLYCVWNDGTAQPLILDSDTGTNTENKTYEGSHKITITPKANSNVEVETESTTSSQA